MRERESPEGVTPPFYFISQVSVGKGERENEKGGRSPTSIILKFKLQSSPFFFLCVSWGFSLSKMKVQTHHNDKQRFKKPWQPAPTPIPTPAKTHFCVFTTCAGAPTLWILANVTSRYIRSISETWTKTNTKKKNLSPRAPELIPEICMFSSFAEMFNYYPISHHRVLFCFLFFFPLIFVCVFPFLLFQGKLLWSQALPWPHTAAALWPIIIIFLYYILFQGCFSSVAARYLRSTYILCCVIYISKDSMLIFSPLFPWIIPSIQESTFYSHSLSYKLLLLFGGQQQQLRENMNLLRCTPAVLQQQSHTHREEEEEEAAEEYFPPPHLYRW